MRAAGRVCRCAGTTRAARGGAAAHGNDIDEGGLARPLEAQHRQLHLLGPEEAATSTTQGSGRPRPEEGERDKLGGGWSGGRRLAGPANPVQHVVHEFGEHRGRRLRGVFPPRGQLLPQPPQASRSLLDATPSVGLGDRPSSSPIMGSEREGDDTERCYVVAYAVVRWF